MYVCIVDCAVSEKNINTVNIALLVEHPERVIELHWLFCTRVREVCLKRVKGVLNNAFYQSLTSERSRRYDKCECSSSK